MPVSRIPAVAAVAALLASCLCLFLLLTQRDRSLPSEIIILDRKPDTNIGGEPSSQEQRLPASATKPSPPVDVSTIGAQVPLSQQHQDLDPFPTNWTGPRDRRVLRVYQSYRDAVRYASERGEKVPAMEALAKLIEQQRFYHFGPKPDKRPPNATSTVRYYTTERNGLYLVFEVNRWEFPEVFAEVEEKQREASKR